MSFLQILGYSAHDLHTIILCMLGGLLGALVHIVIVYVKSLNDNLRQDNLKIRLFAYGFVGLMLGLCLGFVFAGILTDTPAATRTILATSLIVGWQAHRWFTKGVFDAAP